ncbi:MAG: hypothetical protein JSW11_09185 [Candidatus Heimdallarchaeota archaeon]|nr:MAG: hypothetical protein JSW11_09185 [Candidatus Heimdallarchaeota archaeon]
MRILRITIITTVISIIIFIFLPPPLQGVLLAIPITLLLITIFVIIISVFLFFVGIFSGGESDWRM